MRLGIFGGSFDPIHNAHLIVARLACEQLGLDEVRFVVAAAQPLKPAGHGATAEQRDAMVELALAGAPDFFVDHREVRRGGPSYTVDTLRDIAVDRPGAELVLLLGADVAARFGSWHQPDEVRRLCQVAVFARADLAAPNGFDLAIAVPPLAISSTEIRARAAAGRSLIGWVPAKVADYISGLRLYRSNQA